MRGRSSEIAGSENSDRRAILTPANDIKFTAAASLVTTIEIDPHLIKSHFLVNGFSCPIALLQSAWHKLVYLSQPPPPIFFIQSTRPTLIASCNASTQ